MKKSQLLKKVLPLEDEDKVKADEEEVPPMVIEPFVFRLTTSFWAATVVEDLAAVAVERGFVVVVVVVVVVLALTEVVVDSFEVAEGELEVEVFLRHFPERVLFRFFPSPANGARFSNRLSRLSLRAIRAL